jgi:hypothetical protein
LPTTIPIGWLPLQIYIYVKKMDEREQGSIKVSERIKERNTNPKTNRKQKIGQKEEAKKKQEQV